MPLYRASRLDLAVPTKRQKLSTIMANFPVGWDVAMNCGYFNANDSSTIYGLLVYWSRQLNPAGTNWPALVVDPAGRVLMVDESTGITPASVRHASAIGPVLIRSGQVTDINAEISRGSYTGLQPAAVLPRTVVGIDRDGAIIAGCVTDTLPGIAQTLRDLGCLWALYSDGGGSSSVLSAKAGLVFGSDARLLPAAIVLYDAQPIAEAPVPAELEFVVPGVELVVDLIPVGRRNRPAHLMQGPQAVTVHDTGNTAKGADALAHARYFSAGAADQVPVSYHITVDDKRAVQHIPLSENAWHAGDGASGPGNRTTWAVSIAQNSDGDRAKAEDNAARIVAALLAEARLGIEGVKQHADWKPSTGCPAILRARPGGWQGFVAAAAGYLSEGQSDDKDALIADLRRELASVSLDLADARARLVEIQRIAQGGGVTRG